mmetsp:Transcript_40666/g.63908  ORF Transcript_40666/g.63908 Transcript_40666/m.63908 type:complete len:351 (+) Transcript_40666:460-1512(+)
MQSHFRHPSIGGTLNIHNLAILSSNLLWVLWWLLTTVFNVAWKGHDTDDLHHGKCGKDIKHHAVSVPAPICQRPCIDGRKCDRPNCFPYCFRSHRETVGHNSVSRFSRVVGEGQVQCILGHQSRSADQVQHIGHSNAIGEGQEDSSDCSNDACCDGIAASPETLGAVGQDPSEVENVPDAGSAKERPNCLLIHGQTSYTSVGDQPQRHRFIHREGGEAAGEAHGQNHGDGPSEDHRLGCLNCLNCGSAGVGAALFRFHFLHSLHICRLVGLLGFFFVEGFVDEDEQDQGHDTQTAADQTREQSWEFLHHPIGPSAHCWSHQLHATACGKDQAQHIRLPLAARHSNGTRTL